MSLYALPTMTEAAISAYIATNYSGSYNLNVGFGVEELAAPLILVVAGRFKQIEPGTDVYHGELGISVQTQIDDINSSTVVSTHDNTVATIYQLFEDSGAVLAAVNGKSVFNLWSIWENTYDQARDGRLLISNLLYDINCQTLGLGA